MAVLTCPGQLVYKWSSTGKAIIFLIKGTDSASMSFVPCFPASFCFTTDAVPVSVDTDTGLLCGAALS